MTGQELEKIYSEAYRAVYWTAYSLLKNEEDAQDIVQDTFVALIDSYDSIKDKSKIVSWLKKVAANKSLNRLTRTKTDNVEDEFFDTVETVPEDFLPESIVESAEMRKIIMDIINNSLSEDIRRTLILFYFDEMSTREIAEALGIPEGTVSWRISSAKKKIKKEVEKYEEENDTKLFMVVPFLTQLFTKEAEQVPFKPMPATLLNLSASADAAAKAAGSEIAKQAVKKGTEVMLKKIIISGVSIVLVGAATAGIVHVVTRKDEKSDSKKRSRKNEENEISAINPEEESKTAQDGKEETEDTAAVAGYDGDWADSTSFFVYGHEIFFCQSTIQELYDTGCYCKFWIWDETYTNLLEFSIDDEVEIACVTIYPDEASAEDEIGGITFTIDNPGDNSTYLLKEGIVRGMNCMVSSASVWGDNLRFAFPIDMTFDQLKENAGEPDIYYSASQGNPHIQCDYYSSHFTGSLGTYYWEFKFSEDGQLESVWLGM